MVYLYLEQQKSNTFVIFIFTILLLPIWMLLKGWLPSTCILYAIHDLTNY